MKLFPKFSLYFTLFFVTFVFHKVSSQSPQNLEFDYKDPDSWIKSFESQCDPSIYPTQSPINLTPDESLGVRVEERLHLHGYDDVIPKEIILTNDGRYLVMIPRYSEEDIDAQAFVTSGPLIKDRLYNLDHIIWHWGNQSSRGSEHKMDDKFSSMEIQFVHYNKERYHSMSEALKYQDGVVIVSFMFNESIENFGNENLDLFYSHLTQLQEAGSIIQLMQPFQIAQLIKSSTELSSNHQYYSYQGSMTVPPCQNSVTWIVFDTIIPIHKSHIEKLRKLKDAKGNYISKNSRPIQPLQGRTPLRVKMV